jgi:transglutaminase-like putative cysteine protease
MHTRLAAALLSGLAASAAVAGDEPWIDRPFAAEPRAMLAAAREVPAPAGGDVQVLYRDAVYELDADGRMTYRQHLVFRPLTVQGAEAWSTTEVDYAPWHQERPVVRARVIAPGGREEWLEAAALADAPAPSEAADVVADRRVLAAPLPPARPGALVEEETVVRDAAPYFAAGVSGIHPLRMFAAIRRGRLRLVAPITLPLRYGVRGMPELEPRRLLSEGRVELVFDYRDLPPLAPLVPGLPSHETRVPHVAFSTGESWQAVAGSYSRLVDDRIAGTLDAPRLAALAGRLGAPPDSPQRLAQIVAEIHREVRYTGLELGASSLIPAAPIVTLERGFGDCKDQATLLVALLRRDLVPAYVALLSAGFGADVDPRLPGLGRFNHALVYVATSPPLWIDPTEPAARPGELPAADQNRWALIAAPGTEKLLRTPAANSIDNLTVERREVFLADHGPGRVVETSVYRGEPERQQRRLMRSSGEDARAQGYWEYVESTYLAEELGMVEESDPDDFSQPFTLALEALGSGRAMTDLSEAVVAILQDGLVANLPAALQPSPLDPPRETPQEGGDAAQRRHPFVVDQPFVTEWRYRIVPPAGFVLRALPADEQRRLGPALFTRKARREGEEVLLELRFDSGPRFLTPAQFGEMRGAVRDFAGAEPLLVWFDHAGALALAEGRTREAIDHFRRFTELEPEGPIHRIRLAQALLRLGLGREAERQARAATELDAASALAWWSLGFALEHDEIGRRFAAGYDRAAALAALEAAVELAPDDPLARTELAILREYDAAGRRYADAGELERAIAEYRLLRDELQAPNLEANLLSALYWAQRWPELEAAARDAESAPMSRYLRLVALAVLRGPGAAIREAETMAEGQELRGLLTSAVQHLMIARSYRPAAALVRRLARDAANPAPLLARAEVLARARRHEELAVTTADPAALAKSLLLVLGRPRLDREQVAALFHPQYLSERGGAESDLEAAFERIRQEQLTSGGDLPADAVLDMALAILEPAVDGDAQRGYRVRMRNEMEEDVAFTAYLTLHEGRLVIAALGEERGQIGKEVWRRLDRDDLRGAHQWLDWARGEEAPEAAGDPYGFEPFAHFWTRGTGAFRDKMRVGAAILMADQPEAAAAVPVLEQALPALDDERSRAAVEVALLRAYGRLGDETRLGALSARLLERAPRSVLAFVGRCEALLDEGRPDEVQRLAAARLELLPEDPEALRFLARAALRRLAAEDAVRYFERLRSAGALSVEDVSLWAWLLLFRDPIPEEALALARGGADAARQRDRGMLLTLAAVQAELDRPAEAYQSLVQSLELEDEPAPASADWYVYGRIVESYGFAAAAQEYYRRVERPEDGLGYSAFELAQRRLQDLDRGKRRAP